MSSNIYQMTLELFATLTPKKASRDQDSINPSTKMYKYALPIATMTNPNLEKQQPILTHAQPIESRQ